jgi:uncharacterized protein YjbI with pentapeptide repeats
VAVIVWQWRDHGDAELRMLELHQARLLGGRIQALSTQHARLDDLLVESVKFTGCVLAGFQQHGSKLTRVIFRDTKLLAVHISGTSLHDVVFDRRRLDLATSEDVAATGLLCFTGRTLAEVTFANCSLAGALFDHCQPRETSFGRGSYKDIDLRGNNFAEIAGVTNLRGQYNQAALSNVIGELMDPVREPAADAEH